MHKTVLVLLLGTLSASAWGAGDTHFDSCPPFPTPRGAFNTPAPNGLNLIATDPKPNDVQTWFASSFHDLFISTSSGITQKFFDDVGQPEIEISHEPSTGMSLGFDQQGRRTLFAAVGGDQTGVHIFSFLDPKSFADLGVLPANPSVQGTSPCSLSGNAGTDNVIATSNGLAFSTNECLGSGRGSIDVISTRGPFPQYVQRIRLDHAPVGLALNASETRLYVTNETAGPKSLSIDVSTGSVGENVGSLVTFRIDATGGGDGHTFLIAQSAVNPGCAPSRVALDGQGRVWVTARNSNQATVFNASQLGDPVHADASRVATVALGPEPGALKFFDGGSSLAIANTFRSNDLDVHPGYPRPSVMLFKTADLRTDLAPTTPQNLPICAIFGTPSSGETCDSDGCGYNPRPDGDFPRNFAADDQRLYVTLWGDENVQFRAVSVLRNAINACP